MMTLLISEIQNRFPCEIRSAEGQSWKNISVEGVATLQSASPQQISFLANEKYLNEAIASHACAILCSERYADRILSENSNQPVLIVCEDPYAGFAKVSQHFFRPVHPFQGISDQAVIDKTAKIHPTATIFPFVFVGPNAEIGQNTVIYSSCFIGAACKIGDDCLFYPNAVVREGCEVGHRSILNPGAVIGGDGFGFAPTPQENVKIPQIGNVVLGSDVEVGSNATIDRGALDATKVGKQTKIDNLVTIGHNVEIGEFCFLAGQTGIAGSSKIGNRVIAAGQVGVVGHISICDNTTVLAQSGVIKDIKEPDTYLGSPAIPVKEELKQMVVLRRMAAAEERKKEKK